jgi:hypothetical protein
VAHDRHHQHAVVQEHFGEPYVGEVLVDGNAVGVHVLRYRFAGARRSLLERLIEPAGDEGGGMELADVPGEERRHELALAEQTHEQAVRVDDGKRWQSAREQGAYCSRDRLVLPQGRSLLYWELGHKYLTAM